MFLFPSSSVSTIWGRICYRNWATWNVLIKMNPFHWTQVNVFTTTFELERWRWWLWKKRGKKNEWSWSILNINWFILWRGLYYVVLLIAFVFWSVFFWSVEAFQTTHSCHARLDAIQCDDEHQNGNICGVEHVSEWRELSGHRTIFFFLLSLSSFQFSKMFIWIVSRVALNERRYLSIWSLFMASSAALPIHLVSHTLNLKVQMAVHWALRWWWCKRATIHCWLC